MNDSGKNFWSIEGQMENLGRQNASNEIGATM